VKQDLIGHIRETEEARNDFSNAVTQMEDGKSPQPTAPESGPAGCVISVPSNDIACLTGPSQLQPVP
jgi:hypothetical protein